MCNLVTHIVKDTEINPMYIYLEVSPIIDNGTYSQRSEDRIAALSSSCEWETIMFHGVLREFNLFPCFAHKNDKNGPPSWTSPRSLDT